MTRYFNGKDRNRTIAWSGENTIPSGRPYTPGAPTHTCTGEWSQNPSPSLTSRAELAVVTSPMPHMRDRKGAGGGPGWDILPWKAIEPPLEVRPMYRATPNSFVLRARRNRPGKAGTATQQQDPPIFFFLSLTWPPIPLLTMPSMFCIAQIGAAVAKVPVVAGTGRRCAVRKGYLYKYVRICKNRLTIYIND